MNQVVDRLTSTFQITYLDDADDSVVLDDTPICLQITVVKIVEYAAGIINVRKTELFTIHTGDGDDGEHASQCRYFWSSILPDQQAKEKFAHRISLAPVAVVPNREQNAHKATGVLWVNQVHFTVCMRM